MAKQGVRGCAAYCRSLRSHEPRARRSCSGPAHAIARQQRPLHAHTRLAGCEEGGDGGGGEAGAPKRRRRAADLNPEATLENIEALTLKKFDLAFAVDPLFKKTSAQFDEGGAKGAAAGASWGCWRRRQRVQ